MHRVMKGGQRTEERNQIDELDAEVEVVVSDELPDGWIEKLDKKSGRLYYVNE